MMNEHNNVVEIDSWHRNRRPQAYILSIVCNHRSLRWEGTKICLSFVTRRNMKTEITSVFKPNPTDLNCHYMPNRHCLIVYMTSGRRDSNMWPILSNTQLVQMSISASTRAKQGSCLHIIIIRRRRTFIKRHKSRDIHSEALYMSI